MAAFEEDQVKIAAIRAKALGQNKTKAQIDAEIKDYFDKKVKAVQDKLVGTEKAVKATEDTDISDYYSKTVVNERKKLIGK